MKEIWEDIEGYEGRGILYWNGAMWTDKDFEEYFKEEDTEE